MIETTYPNGENSPPLHRVCCDSCGKPHQHSSTEGGARQYARDAMWAVHSQEPWDKLPVDRCLDCELAFCWLSTKGWTWERLADRWTARFGFYEVTARTPALLREQVACWLEEMSSRRHRVLIAE